MISEFCVEGWQAGKKDLLSFFLSIFVKTTYHKVLIMKFAVGIIYFTHNLNI